MEEQSAAAPFRVGLVDDHEVIELALRAALESSSDLEFVGSAPTVNELLWAMTPPTLVVLDLRLSDGSSPAANVQKLRAAGCHVLAYTSGESPYLTQIALRSEVLGIVRKSEPVASLRAAVETAARGLPVMTAEWATAVESDPLLGEAKLSVQETRILTLFADGNKAQVVASSLMITVGTLEDYVRRIRAKYAAAGRPAFTKVDLYKRAVEDGLLPLPSKD